MVCVEGNTSRFIKWVSGDCKTGRIKLLRFLLVSVKSRVDIVHGQLLDSLTVVIIQISQLRVGFFIELTEN